MKRLLLLIGMLVALFLGAEAQRIDQFDSLQTADLSLADYMWIVDDDAGFPQSRRVSLFSLNGLFGSGLSLGADQQVPYMNPAGDDFLFSNAFRFDGTNLVIGAVSYPGTDGTSGHVLTTNGAGIATFQALPTFTLTNGSGTTASGTAVDLGGTQSGDVLIDADGNDFEVAGGSSGNSFIRLQNSDEEIRIRSGSGGAGFTEFEMFGNSPGFFRLRNNAGNRFRMDASSLDMMFANGSITSSVTASVNGVLVSSTDDATSEGIGSSYSVNGWEHLIIDDQGDGLGFQFDTGGGMIVLDDIGSAGLTYDADYSANYTNRSIVDKEYVDNAGGFSLSNGQGTTAAGSAVNLGGSYTSNISVSSTNGSTLSMISGQTGTFSSELNTNSGVAELEFTDVASVVNTYFRAEDDMVIVGANFFGLAAQEIRFDGSNMTVDDDVNSKGFEYAADYSSNYTNRSLVDKEYVDDIAGATGLLSGSTTGVTNVSVIGANVTGTWTRAGNIVTVAGQVTITATATGNTSFRFNLPVASDLASSADAIGTCVRHSVAQYNPGFVIGDAANDEALVQFNASDTGSGTLYLTFQYEVK